MNWSTWSKASELRYRFPPMPARIASAQRLLSALFARCERPYVAYSGGKDSQVVLDLAIRLKPDVAVVWHDEDWLLPGTAEFVEGVEQRYGIHILRVRERFAADEFHAAYGVWPRCAHPRPVDFEADRWPEIVAHYGFDGVALGLRSEESAGRYFALKTPLRLTRKDGLWHCSPLHDWTAADVWAYLCGRDCPCHHVYETMIDAGIAPEFARVGPLTATRVYGYGLLDTLKRLWPETWNAFAAENPCVLS